MMEKETRDFTKKKNGGSKKIEEDFDSIRIMFMSLVNTGGRIKKELSCLEIMMGGMCEYFLGKDAPSYMIDENERLEEEKDDLTMDSKNGIRKLYKEFDEWARAKGFLDISNKEIDELKRK
ncbi:hypothetical protein Tco_0971029 [Tanacetum coccineum]